jgi:hypothetical protein
MFSRRAAEIKKNLKSSSVISSYNKDDPSIHILDKKKKFVSSHH